MTAPPAAATAAAAEAWAALGIGLPPHAIRVLQDRGSVTLRMAAAGPAGEDIVAQRFRPRRARVERSIHAWQLPPDVGKPRCWGFVEDSDGCTWGFFTAVDGRRYRPADPVDRRLAARWLAALHGATADAPERAPLPSLDGDHWLDRAREAKDGLSAVGAANSGDGARVVSALAHAIERLEHVWEDLMRACALLPTALVHGDFAAKNLLVRDDSDGPALFALDWGEAGCGTPAIDLAQSLPGTADPDLALYTRLLSARLPAVTAPLVAEAARAGTVLRAISGSAWGVERGPLRAFTRDELARYTAAIETWLAGRSG